MVRSPRERAWSVLIDRTVHSVAAYCDAAIWGFSTSGFHRLFATKPAVSETKENVGQDQRRPSVTVPLPQTQKLKLTGQQNLIRTC